MARIAGAIGCTDSIALTEELIDRMTVLYNALTEVLNKVLHSFIILLLECPDLRNQIEIL